MRHSTISNLTAFPFIGERSEATPGLWNRAFSQLSDNIRSAAEGPFSSSTDTFSFSTNLEVTGGVHFQFLSVGSTPPSYVTTALITMAARSDQSDYLYFTDSSGLRSNYVIGSRAGGTADGLNIWDASGATMIASFSKQSIRFYQNVVGPVFDVGGALANTLNAATFGTGADSTESRIQAAIDQASISAISRVYVPANMYPYSASSVSFVHSVQMVREGGDWSVYDVKAYGANPNNSASATSSFEGAASGASRIGGTVYIPEGTYKLSHWTLYTGVSVRGAGASASLLNFTGTTRDAITLISGTLSTFNVRLGDFTLSSGGSAGIVCQLAAGVQLERLNINSFTKAGVHLLNNCFEISLVDCLFQNFANYGVRLGNNANNNRILNCSFAAANGGTAIKADPNVYQLYIQGCNLEGSSAGTNAVYLDGTQGCFYTANYSEAWTSSSLIADGCGQISLINNYFGGGSAVSQYVDVSLNGTREVAVWHNFFSGLGNASSGSLGVKAGTASRLAVWGNNSDGAGPIVQWGGSNQSAKDFDNAPSYRSDGRALIPSYTFASEQSLGFFRSGASTMALSYGSLQLDGLASSGRSIVVSGATMVTDRLYVKPTGSSATFGIGLEGNFGTSGYSSMLIVIRRVDDAASYMGGLIWEATGTKGWGIEQNYTVGPNVIEFNYGATNFLSLRTTRFAGIPGTALSPGWTFTSEQSLGWYRSAASTMALSYGTLLVNGPLWSSGISVGPGGTQIPAISSMSSLVGAFIVQPSSSSFTGITWAAAGIGDIILCAPFQSGAASSVSSGLVPHSLVTVAGQIEFRLSNVSTLVQNQSAQTWVFTRIRPF